METPITENQLLADIARAETEKAEFAFSQAYWEAKKGEHASEEASWVTKRTEHRVAALMASCVAFVILGGTAILATCEAHVEGSILRTDKDED